MPLEIVKSFSLFFVLLNPFLMSIYLLDIIRKSSVAVFARTLTLASIISSFVFIFFAWIGEAFFTDVLQVRFASFLIFGGIIFLIIGVRYALLGGKAIEQLRGPAKNIAGSVSVPFMIGPGTVSASIITGKRLSLSHSFFVIALSLFCVVISVVILKMIHDYIHMKNEPVVERYIDITGRVSSLIIGTIAVEMILKGVDVWLNLQ